MLETGEYSQQIADVPTAVTHFVGSPDPGVAPEGAKLVPFYDVDFMGGFGELENDQCVRPDDWVVSPGFERATLWCRCVGRSMEPMICNGDLIALRHCRLEDVQYGSVYAVVLDTIRTIKEAQAEKEKTKAARMELQSFMSALQNRKAEQQKNRDEYIDRKLEQLTRRQEKEKARRARRDGKSPEAETAEKKDSLRGGPLQVGEKVRVRDNGMVGEVSKVSNKAVTLIIGNISSKMPLDRVERISSNEFKAAVKESSRPSLQKVDCSIQERKLNFKMELDVRGERLGDALDIVTHYIDDAIMLDIPSVRIIHGKGTGVLREEIQKYLRTIPGISSAKDEHIQQGGSGVTVVTFDR